MSMLLRLWKASPLMLQEHADHSTLNRTMENIDTYVTPLVTDSTAEDDANEAREFLETFDVSERTDDIIRTLQDYAIVKDMFEALVPLQVSYEQFWARFFFRCDADRIHQQQCDVADPSSASWSLPNPLNAVPNPLDVVMGKFDCEEEVTYRRNLQEIYTDELLCDLEVGQAEASLSWEMQYELQETREFLSSFDIGAKTDEIARVLEEHPDTVRVYFEALVPLDVTYSDFWTRYFFRCDGERIARAWDAYQNHLQEERRRIMHSVKRVVAKTSTDVLVGPFKTALKTSFHFGHAVVSTALVPVGVIANAATHVVRSSNLSLQETTPAPQNKDRVKLLQKKLVETKRKLRESKADASRLRNQLMKAQDALHVRPGHAPLAISFSKRKIAATNNTEDNTSSSAITEDSILCEEWSADDEKDPSETSVTACDDGLSAGTTLPHVPSSAVFQLLRRSNGTPCN